MSDEVTPIRQQYLNIKKQYPDTIVFFRLGDFYETFDEDAQITSRELDLVLTSRNVAKGMRIPMAGIPYHAVDNYLARLIDKGFHVAICEQVGEQPAKGLFPREVVRVVTPGTVTEPSLLRSDENNYIAAICADHQHAGLAFADISTGEFATTQLEGDPISLLRAEISRLNPSEILLPDDDSSLAALSGHLTRWPYWKFELSRSQSELNDHFNSATLDGFGLRGKPFAVRAAGALLQYLRDTQPSSLTLLQNLKSYSPAEYMVLDATTRRNLEITETIRDGAVKGSLLGVLDKTVTAMGKRLIRQWIGKPLLECDKIIQRQQGIQALMDTPIQREELKAHLKQIADIERITGRIQSGTALPRDLTALRSTLQVLPGLEALFAGNSRICDLILGIGNFQPELTLLESAIAEDPPATLQNTGIIKSGYSPELDSIISSSEHARQWISNLEAIERERTGIKTLKVGYNKVFGYYIEISRGAASQAPAEYIRKQTLVNAERFITPEMKEYEALVLNAEDRIHEIEIGLFKQVCSQLAASTPEFMRAANHIAELDCLLSLSEVSLANGYVCPVIKEDTTLAITGGRHPVVEQMLHSERFVPNDTVFEDGEIVRVITGPNMSGKSTFLRQTALIILMAQIGCFVPAQSATIGLVDRIFTRIGAQDEIHSGQSTFMVEMVETANILHNATQRSLLILDEIGRGTSTYDGVSIAWSVIEYIHNNPALRSRTIFATHYHELTQLSEFLPGLRNYNVAVSDIDGKIVFLHKIIPGSADRSYGIHVGQLAGLPQAVVNRAGEILANLESQGTKAIKIDPDAPMQMRFFPENNAFTDDISALDVNGLTPIEALNKLYEWKRKFSPSPLK